MMRRPEEEIPPFPLATKRKDLDNGTSCDGGGVYVGGGDGGGVSSALTPEPPVPAPAAAVVLQ